MRALCVGLLVLLLCSSPGLAASPFGARLGSCGVAILGASVGVVASVSAIANVAPQIESRLGKTAFVIGSLTILDGLGAAMGVLTAAKLWDTEGHAGRSILGGMAGGFVSAFTEPILMTIGIPEGWTEFIGMALLPLLPAVGAMLGFAG
ncbi:hypothetical protein IH601_09045 [Candidatus Bipolaricaulota bacterium]|nr:hypothetical protein [Candidatus Bipolaricaulota bacterium]TFH08401.1 MAG: hypothetical protein E4H08_07860 [Candidatus Atribacteria bacterium]